MSAAENLVGKQRVLTKLPPEVREQLKTRKQWLKLGYVVPVPLTSGVVLRINSTFGSKIRYYHRDEVRPACKEELAAEKARVKTHKPAARENQDLKELYMEYMEVVYDGH